MIRLFKARPIKFEIELNKENNGKEVQKLEKTSMQTKKINHKLMVDPTNTKNKSIPVQQNPADNEKLSKTIAEKKTLDSIQQKIRFLADDEGHRFSKRSDEVLQALKILVEANIARNRKLNSEP